MVNILNMLFRLSRKHKSRICNFLMLTQIIVIHHSESADLWRFGCFEAGQYLSSIYAAKAAL